MENTFASFTSKVTAICLCLLLVLVGVAPVRAGGALERINTTGDVPTGFENRIFAGVVGIRWDARTLPVQYSMNTTQDPIPNPTIRDPFLTVAAARTALQRSFDAWNDNPVSYIDMRITKETDNSGLVGFDFVNELTFRTAADFDAIASSPSVTLTEDSELVDGDQLDNDTDSDVSSAITAAQDVDGDGDIEFPAGFYKAGTILDNDVQFNTKDSNGLEFTVSPTLPNDTSNSVDLDTVAVHEFGHSHGLSHSLPNQMSASDGTPATMFPFIDTADAASELAQRSPAPDDVAYSSYFYPEGSAEAGPAALQEGDIAFDSAYSLIRGNLRHGFLDQQIAGGNVFANSVGQDRNTTSIAAYSGTVRLSLNPDTGSANLFNDPNFGIIDGNYVIPVPKGNYEVGVEAVDGSPVEANRINLTTQVGSLYGQQNFTEEFYNGRSEAAREDNPGERQTVAAETSPTGIDITTNRALNINSFGTPNFIRTAAGYFAVRVSASQLNEIVKKGDLVIQAASFDTGVVIGRSSALPVFVEATLTTGIINPDGSATLNRDAPLARVGRFISQDNDFGRFYFDDPRTLGQTVRAGVQSGAIKNLFIVLRIPAGNNIVFFRLDGTNNPNVANDVPLLPNSFRSDPTNDPTFGIAFRRDFNFNFRFSLQVSEPVRGF